MGVERPEWRSSSGKELGAKVLKHTQSHRFEELWKRNRPDWLRGGAENVKVPGAKKLRPEEGRLT